MRTKLKEKVNFTFRALKHRNYKLFFWGQCISLIGTWIQQIAVSWLVYNLTHSALLMGVIVFVGSLPALVLSPFAGVFADRVNKYRALIAVQSLFMLQAFVLAILTMTGVVNIWYVLLLNVFAGIVMTFDMPLRQAFVVKLVEGSEDLVNAISLNSTIFNLARLIGPAIAGILIAKLGEGICFLANSLSYIAVIASFFMMRIEVSPQKKDFKTHVLEELSEGIKYAFNSIPIRIIIIYMATVSLFGMFYPLLMPIYAKEILHGDAQTMGFLMSSAGIGALCGALYLAGRKSYIGLEKWVSLSSISFALGLLGLNFVDKFSIALVLLFMIGFGFVIIMAAGNTLIQHLVEDDKRGRIMSLFMMAFMGTAPVGSLCSGAIAHKIGVPHTFLLSGLVMLVAAIIFSTKWKHFKDPNIYLNT